MGGAFVVKYGYHKEVKMYFQNIGTGSFAFGCKGTALAVSDMITPQTKFYTGFMVIVQ
jgi:hypothetical protein